LGVPKKITKKTQDFLLRFYFWWGKYAKFMRFSWEIMWNSDEISKKVGEEPLFVQIALIDKPTFGRYNLIIEVW
jgi:hypothetical protein